MTTKGGYEVIKFKQLEEPIVSSHYLEPHVYEGIVKNCPFGDNIKQDIYLTWDKLGRCNNWSRTDCFIEIKSN